MARPLSADEAALWARVMAGVRPLRPVARLAPMAGPAASAPRPARPSAAVPAVPPPVQAPGRARPGTTLDASWDRDLARGRIAPDRMIDLHGHTLHSAHGLLDVALERAIAGGERLILLVTGKPPGPESERPHRRGAIRAAVGDWLAKSRHAERIAAVRGAAPRHGGPGALYIVLRRTRAARIAASTRE